jgi:hypothetical protein
VPQKELKLSKRYTIDPVTGYKDSNDPRSNFVTQLKVKFIEAFKLTGDVSDACQAVGISRRILTAHFRSDSKFKQDYLRAKEIVKESPIVNNTKAVIERLWS